MSCNWNSTLCSYLCTKLCCKRMPRFRSCIWQKRMDMRSMYKEGDYCIPNRLRLQEKSNLWQQCLHRKWCSILVRIVVSSKIFKFFFVAGKHCFFAWSYAVALYSLVHIPTTFWLGTRDRRWFTSEALCTVQHTEGYVKPCSSASKGIATIHSTPITVTRLMCRTILSFVSRDSNHTRINGNKSQYWRICIYYIDIFPFVDEIY